MITVIKEDITKLSVDAIVNAANSSLLGGGGVDGAIHKNGGSKILEECISIKKTLPSGYLDTGKVIITSGGNLPCKFVIHTVGPIWNNTDENKEQLLSECYQNSLDLARQNNCLSIAFPNISTGVYRFPKDLAAKIAIKTVKNYLKQNTSIKEIIFCCYDEENFKIYEDLIINK